MRAPCALQDLFRGWRLGSPATLPLGDWLGVSVFSTVVIRAERLPAIVGEARLGQVARLMRSQIDLSPAGAFGLGRVVVHGAGKKLGVTRDLTPEERAAIDRALAGYLSHLEAACGAPR